MQHCKLQGILKHVHTHSMSQTGRVEGTHLLPSQCSRFGSVGYGAKSMARILALDAFLQCICRSSMPLLAHQAPRPKWPNSGTIGPMNSQTALTCLTCSCVVQGNVQKPDAREMLALQFLEPLLLHFQHKEVTR
eukprot:5307635-Amphidinium_carterae.1